MGDKKEFTFEFPQMDKPVWEQEDWQKNKKKAKKKAKQFRKDFQTFWETGIDFQKSAIDKNKEQFDMFFANMQEAKDAFADFLPDEDLPFAPEEFSSPKKIRKAMKEWEKMANEQFVSQADALAEFAIKSQEKACAELPEIPEDEDKEDPEKKEAPKAKATPKPKAEPKPKAAATKTTPAKSTTTKAAAKTTTTKAAAKSKTAAK